MATPNITYELPPLPEYTLRPLPPLISWFPDAYLALALPVIGYWLVSLIFHVIDVYDLFPQHRLHTPAEVLKRNHATRWEVFRDVIIQQIVQAMVGIPMNLMEGPVMTGKDDFNVAWYAQKIRIAQRAIPIVLTTAGLDSTAIATKVSASLPTLAGAIAGGQYGGVTPEFQSWELLVAKALYWYGIPAVQFLVGILMVDTWEYCLHRLAHVNKWLYVTFHSRHHRLYVPYAYGALYNHPIEGLVLDTCGTGLAYLATGMTIRQSMWFFTGSTIKTVDDHCGYSLPYDPLQRFFPNNAGYHDIHHQSWGIKTNFSQPFFTFWDKWCDTMWKGDTTSRYEKGRQIAQMKLDQENENKANPTSPDTLAAAAAEVDETIRSQSVSTRTTRKKASSISQSPSDNLKGLRNKVNESLHGRGANVLGVESRH